MVALDLAYREVVVSFRGMRVRLSGVTYGILTRK